MGIRCFFGLHPHKNNNQHTVAIAALSDISIGRGRLVLTITNMTFIGNYHYCVDCGKVVSQFLNYGREELTREIDSDLHAFKNLVDLDGFNDIVTHLVDRATANSEYKKTQLDLVLNLSSIDERIKGGAASDQKKLTSHYRALETYLDRKSVSGEAPYRPVEDENITILDSVIAEHNRLKALLPVMIEQYFSKGK